MPRVTTTAARLPRRYLLGVFSLALVIRLGALLVSGPKLGVDSLEYLAWAHALSSGLSALPVLRVEHHETDACIRERLSGEWRSKAQGIAESRLAIV